MSITPVAEVISLIFTVHLKNICNHSIIDKWASLHSEYPKFRRVLIFMANQCRLKCKPEDPTRINWINHSLKLLLGCISFYTYKL
jgi:hypothetical protein